MQIGRTTETVSLAPRHQLHGRDFKKMPQNNEVCSTAKLSSNHAPKWFQLFFLMTYLGRQNGVDGIFEVQSWS